MKETRLLPETSWKHCKRCKRAVPEFELSEALQTKLDAMLSEGKGPSAAGLLVRQTGCERKVAEAWTVHRLETGEYQQVLPPCPWCGQTSQSNRTKQCRFCGGG